MSVHVGLLAAGVPFPLPQPPVWAQWLNEFFMAGALLAFLKLAHPSMAHRSIMARTIIAFVIGYAVIRWLLNYVATRSYMPFVIYRICLGVLVLVLLGTGVLASA